MGSGPVAVAVRSVGDRLLVVGQKSSCASEVLQGCLQAILLWLRWGETRGWRGQGSVGDVRWGGSGGSAMARAAGAGEGCLEGLGG